MGAANHDHWASRTWSGLDSSRRALLGERHTLSAAADDPAPSKISRGCCNNADERSALLDQCNIDGEFITPGNEFSGPVERIDEEISRPFGLPSMRLIFGGLLFRNDRDTGREAFKILQKDGFGGFIRRRDGRAIGLIAERSRATFPNRGCGAAGSRRQLPHQGYACANVEGSHGVDSLALSLDLALHARACWVLQARRFSTLWAGAHDCRITCAMTRTSRIPLSRGLHVRTPERTPT